MEGYIAEPRERVLIAAEHLFAERGYGSVTLRQIGARAGINHSSLYHHVPGGKADLFVEVMERIFERHRIGMLNAIHAHKSDLQHQLYAIADWFVSHEPIDLVRMQHVDLLELSQAQQAQLTASAYAALQQPMMQALLAAQQAGTIWHDDLELISGGIIGLIQSLHAVSETVAGKTRQHMAQRLIDVILDGIVTR
jgi:AcrR family transcriptional regulator